MVGALFRLVFALLWLLSTLNMLGALRLLGDASYLQVFEADRLQVLARLYVAANFRRLLCRSAIFWIGRDCLRLFVAQVELHPERIGCLWCDLVCVVRDLRFCFPHFPRLRQNQLIDYWFDSPMAIFELVLSFWLLFKGLNTKAWERRPYCQEREEIRFAALTRVSLAV